MWDGPNPPRRRVYRVPLKPVSTFGAVVHKACGTGYPSARLPDFTIVARPASVGAVSQFLGGVIETWHRHAISLQPFQRKPKPHWNG